MNTMMRGPIEEHAPLAEGELRTLLLDYRRENWKGIQTPQVQRQVVEDLISGDAATPLRAVEPYVAISRESRILDLGSGVGGFVIACRERGLQAFGLEPDRIGQGAHITSIQIARRRLSAPVFVNGVGEALPFSSECFDLVVMNQVIEHVENQRAVVREAARVLGPGGALYVACPNYLRFYEPHYKILWMPLLPKALGRIYLRLRGRSPAMLNQLTYTTNSRLRKLLAEFGTEYTVLDLHCEQFLRKRSAQGFAAKSTRLVAALTRLPVLGSVVLGIVLRYMQVREGGCEMLILRRPQAAAR
jgi:SAM-dependent methyltransferase